MLAGLLLHDLWNLGLGFRAAPCGVEQCIFYLNDRKSRLLGLARDCVCLTRVRWNDGRRNTDMREHASS